MVAISQRHSQDLFLLKHLNVFLKCCLSAQSCFSIKVDIWMGKQKACVAVSALEDDFDKWTNWQR
jgi:hypothetical protein